MPPPLGGVWSPWPTSTISSLPLIELPAGASVPGLPAPWVCCVGRLMLLFRAILANPAHVLHHLLPPARVHPHNFRRRTHQRAILIRDKFTDLNFIRRMLFT